MGDMLLGWLFGSKLTKHIMCLKLANTHADGESVHNAALNV